MRAFIGFWTVVAVVTATILGWRRFGVSSPADTTWPPNRPVTYKEVAARPEGHLVYPNSKLWYPLGDDENTSGFNSSQGKAGAMLLSEDSPDQIYAWYRHWLLGAGWQLTYSGPGTTSAWKTCDKYQRGSREFFTVGIDDPVLLGVLLGGKVPKARNILEVRYIIVPYSYT